jgi:hypothetical protein
MRNEIISQTWIDVPFVVRGTKSEPPALPKTNSRYAARAGVSTVKRIRRTIPSLREGRTFESVGLAVLFALTAAALAAGYVWMFLAL